jgi:hypothetical protein
MKKLYLRYAQRSVFGLVASSGSSVCWDWEGKAAFVGALEAVQAWNLRQLTLVRAWLFLASFSCARLGAWMPLALFHGI